MNLQAEEPVARYLVALEPPLLRSFDLLAGAPKGVARLRELILSLAVRGKLVPQDLGDEPASMLLERIRAEKARLVAAGKIRREKPLVAIAKMEVPFHLPSGWAPTCLAELGAFSGGKTPSTHRSEYWGGTIPWVTSKDMKSLLISVTQDAVTPKALADGLSLIPSGAILLVVRSGILRRTVPVAITGVPCTINQDLKALQLAFPSMGQYVQLMVRGFERFILETLTKVGTTVESIRFEDLERQPFPLPPLAEQSRIVARVEALMRLCDELEAKGRLEAEQHARLVGTLFEALAASESAHALAENWQRIAAHFDLLLDRPEAVDALEQTLLQLAVRGLLVPQDPADEPASALLEKIRAEKHRLIAAGKLKRDKPLPPIAEDEMPFELPEGWEWVRLSELLPEFQNGVSSRGDHDGMPVTVLRLADIKTRRISLEDTREIPIKSADINKYKLANGDILIVRVNGSAEIVGNFILSEHDISAIYCDHFIRMRIDRRWMNPRYMALLGETRLVRDRISSLFITTAGQKTVNQGHIGSLFIAFPPLPEQSRIVARVEQLRRLCADLRARLGEARATQSHLAETLVEQTV
jgi:type I restriction enzyme, S subunit